MDAIVTVEDGSAGMALMHCLHLTEGHAPQHAQSIPVSCMTTALSACPVGSTIAISMSYGEIQLYTFVEHELLHMAEVRVSLQEGDELISTSIRENFIAAVTSRCIHIYSFSILSKRKVEDEEVAADAAAIIIESSHIRVNTSQFQVVKEGLHPIMEWMVPRVGGMKRNQYFACADADGR